MRKSLKKALSALLAVILLLSAVPIMASATSVNDLEYVIENGEVTITGYKDSLSGNLVIPDTIEDYPVKHIGNDAFSFCFNLLSISIPNSITSIGEYAFFNCEKAEIFTIPNSVKTIGKMAFGNCDKLEKVVIPSSVTNIELGAFGGCTNIASISVDKKNVVYDSRDNSNAIIETATNTLIWGCQNTTIPYGIINIGVGAFSDCRNLNSIKIPNSVKRIDNGAFELCTGLKSIEMSNSITSIGEYAFYDCTRLTSITLPNNIMTIEEGTFQGCKNLNSIVIPDSVGAIGEGAFGVCPSLISITIPDNITYIDRYAFDGCEDLTIYCYKNSYAHSFADYYGIKYELIEKPHTHSYKHIVIPADCVTSGMEYDICPDCGDVINSKVISATGHSWGEWKTTIEPTGTKEGKAERKCTKCSATETKAIEKLNIVKDEKTGIEIEYKDQFDKNLEIKVEEKFDGKSYQLLDMECENSKYHIFDITTYENGKKVQPDGKVTVRIPLPDGFGTKNLLVCHVDAENNKVTYIPAKVVGNFVEFSAEHFSDYAVVELSGIVEKVNVNDVELKYKKTAKITPEVTLDGDVKYTVKYESSNPSVATVDKDGWITTFGKGETKITCTVTDTYGNTVKDTCTVTVKFSFGQWLIWILLFGFLWY